MENWHTSPWKAHIVLACITCENIALLKTKAEILEKKGPSINVFLPTVCVSCEKDEMRGFGKSGMGSLSISHNIIRMWQPFLEMSAFLEGAACPKDKGQTGAT